MIAYRLLETLCAILLVSQAIAQEQVLSGGWIKPDGTISFGTRLPDFPKRQINKTVFLPDALQVQSGGEISTTGARAFGAVTGDDVGISVFGRSSRGHSRNSGVLSLDMGVVCDGVTDTSSAIIYSINLAIATNRPFYVQSTGQHCVINFPINIPSNLEMIGIGKPVIRTTSSTNPTIFSLNGVSRARVRGFVLDGGTRTTVYSAVAPIINITGAAARYNSIEDIEIQNAPRDVRIQAGAAFNTIRRVHIDSPGYYHNTTGSGYAITYNGFTLSAATDNLMEDIYSTGHAGWTVGVINGSMRNTVNRVKSGDSGLEIVGVQYPAKFNRLNGIEGRAPIYPVWTAGETVARGTRRIASAKQGSNTFAAIYIADTDGTAGSTAPNCANAAGSSPHPQVSTPVQCSDGGVTWTFWRDLSAASDNCVSITGSYNSVENANVGECRGHAFSIYGDHNTLANSREINTGTSYPYNKVNYYCVNLQSAFGGVSQFNNIANITCEDTNSISNISAAIRLDKQYPGWAAGLMINAHPLGGGTYVTSAGNLYQSRTTGAVTATGSAPTHTSGTVTGADGVAWVWIRATPNGTDVINNTVVRIRPGSFRDSNPVSSVVLLGQPNNIFTTNSIQID